MMLKNKIQNILIQNILILILMLITIANMYSVAYAKYTLDYTIDAAEVRIENDKLDLGETD